MPVPCQAPPHSAEGLCRWWCVSRWAALTRRPRTTPNPNATWRCNSTCQTVRCGRWAIFLRPFLVHRLRSNSSPYWPRVRRTRPPNRPTPPRSRHSTMPTPKSCCKANTSRHSRCPPVLVLSITGACMLMVLSMPAGQNSLASGFSSPWAASRGSPMTRRKPKAPASCLTTCASV